MSLDAAGSITPIKKYKHAYIQVSIEKDKNIKQK